ncbi:MAG: DUF4405 domain-containing protein [Tenuifilaceae bacterium]|jgi:hypothetical protein|nr:DUF4405 domain-containing protein [Tenuifilaceae bacterium]
MLEMPEGLSWPCNDKINSALAPAHATLLTQGPAQDAQSAPQVHSQKLIKVLEVMQMEKYLSIFLVNLGLLVSGFSSAFSGILIQVKYHMGNHGIIMPNEYTLGLSYSGWAQMHKVAIVMLTILMIFHLVRHWKWYRIVVKKRLIRKKQQVVTLTILFIFVAVTGLIPWLIDLMNGDEMLRKALVEIHDKLSIILTLYFILHIAKRFKWFLTTFERMAGSAAHSIAR